MKLIHIADMHLLMQPEKELPIGKERAAELSDTFARIIDICNTEDVDLLLIAGDLFHIQPRQKDLKELAYRFGQLLRTKVVLIAGNHDYAGARSNYPAFARENGWLPDSPDRSDAVTMLLDDSMGHVTFPELKTTVYGLSYHTRDVKEAVYDAERPLGSGINILLAHGGDSKNAPMNFDRIAANGWDYVALGHIHKPQMITKTMAYSGSPEPLDRNETGPHGYMSVEITEVSGSYETTASFVPFSKREYRDITVPCTADMTQAELCDRLSEIIAKQGEQNMYRIFLTGCRAAEMTFDTSAIRRLGTITEVLDMTRPEYDLERLRADNADNLVGMFIDALKDRGEFDEVAQKALDYGLSALLGDRR